MSKSQIFSIINSKGGVGKTTTTLNLGAALAASGERVLLIDNDAQGNLTAAMGFTPAEQKNSLAKLLLAAVDAPEDLEIYLPRTILHTESGIDLIPANKRLADAAAAGSAGREGNHGRFCGIYAGGGTAGLYADSRYYSQPGKVGRRELKEKW